MLHVIIAQGEDAKKGYLSDFIMAVFCVFSLKSPHRGDFNKYTQYTIFYIK